MAAQKKPNADDKDSMLAALTFLFGSQQTLKQLPARNEGSSKTAEKKVSIGTFPTSSITFSAIGAAEAKV
jgi:hypothetical protein